MRNKTIIIRCTEEEHAQLLANKERVELARWLRELGLNQSEFSRKQGRKSQRLPPEVLRFMAGVGNNLNQLAKQVNTAAKVNEFSSIDTIALLTQLAATERALIGLREYLKRGKEET